MTNLELESLFRALAKLHEVGSPEAAYEVIKATVTALEEKRGAGGAEEKKSVKP